MDDIASAVTAIAAVVCVVVGIVTMARRVPGWRRSTVGQFGFAVVLGLASLSIRAHSPALDLVVVAGGLAMLGWTVYSARQLSAAAK